MRNRVDHKEIARQIKLINSDILRLEEKLGNEENVDNIEAIKAGLARLKAKKAAFSAPEEKTYLKAGDKMYVDDREAVIEGVYYKAVLLNKDGEETKQARYIPC